VVFGHVGCVEAVTGLRLQCEGGGIRGEAAWSVGVVFHVCRVEREVFELDSNRCEVEE